MKCRARRIVVLLAFCLVFGGLGVLLGYVLRGRPILAAVTLGLVLVGGGLLWWKLSESDRKIDIRHWLRYRWRRAKRLPLTVLGALIVMAVVSSVVGFWGTGQGWKELGQNLGAELVGAVLTFVLIDLVLRTRQRKESLIAQMGSEVRDEAIVAVEELKREGWLFDGSLQDAKLVGANLSKAELSGAVLPGALLIDADLSHAHLNESNLQGAKLHGANLSSAFLIRANLTDDAKLSAANLSNADLRGADLTGSELALLDVDLSGANLKDATVSPKQLWRAESKSLAGTILYNGKELSEENWKAEFKEWRKKQEKQNEDERSNSSY